MDAPAPTLMLPARPVAPQTRRVARPNSAGPGKLGLGMSAGSRAEVAPGEDARTQTKAGGDEPLRKVRPCAGVLCKNVLAPEWRWRKCPTCRTNARKGITCVKPLVCVVTPRCSRVYVRTRWYCTHPRVERYDALVKWTC
ncbi:hypothetical protein C8Q77DRAFT_159060 [Trametes polyzona]|nr:hypothetical protein C8Q77DRAFT_159060 [Trametes polyzona]